MLRKLNSDYMRPLSLLLVILFATSLSYGQEVKMSLDECLTYALENNENVKGSDLERGISKAKVDETRGIGLPKAAISAGSQYNYQVQRSLLPAGFFDPDAMEGDPDVELQFGQAYAGDIAFRVEQLIFDGTYLVGLRAAKTYRQLADKDYIASKIDVIESVKKAYFTVLINEQSLGLVNKNLLRLMSSLDDTKKLYENGFTESTDVDKLQVSYNNLLVEQERLSKLTALSYDLLKYQMGMTLTEKFELSQGLEDFETPQDPTNALNYNNRVEYSKLLTNEELIELDLKKNKIESLPSLGAFFNYGRNTQGASFSQLTDGSRWLGYGSVGLSLTIPVFDGLSKQARVQQNKIQLKQFDLQKSFLKKSIDVEVREKMINKNSALKSIDIQKQNVDLAKRIYATEKLKYKEGIGSNLDFITADTNLKEAETDYYQSIYDMLIAQVELEKALGILLK